MFSLLHRGAGDHAFALLVDLQHVKFSFLPIPAKNNLEDVRDVGHQIDRVVPTNHQPSRFEIGFRSGLFFTPDVGRNFRHRQLSHAIN